MITYFLLIISRESFAQGSFYSWKLPLLIPYLENQSFGYCDSSFKIKIRPQFREADLFLEDCDIRDSKNPKAKIASTNNYASVVNNKGKHRINFKGEIKYTYRDKDRNVCDVATSNTNFELIYFNNKYGIKNTNGDTIIDPIYDAIFSVSEYGLQEPFIVKIKNKYGLISADKKLLISLIYDEIYPSGEYYWAQLPLSKVLLNGQVFMVDWYGREYLKK